MDELLQVQRSRDTSSSDDGGCGCGIPPQSGRGFRSGPGDLLRVIDAQGEQVCDLFAFRDGDPTGSLSSGCSIDYAGRLHLSVGDTLWSNDSRPMFTIVRDDVGRHDFLLTPRSQEMFELLYQHHGHPCSAEGSNNGTFKPIDLEVIPGHPT